MGKFYKTHKQFQARKRAQAVEMKQRLIERWLMPTAADRRKVERFSVIELSARFDAAKIDMISGTCKDNRGHEFLPGEQDAVKGLQFQGLIEPESFEAGDLQDLVPASSEDFTVSLPELRRGEMVFVFSNENGELRAIPYK